MDSSSDREAYEAILSVPWLKSSVIPTGTRWGKRIVDVKMSRLPQNLLGQVMFVPSDPKDLNSQPLTDEVALVIFRWDRNEYMGWEKEFPVVLTFPDNQVYEVEVPPSIRLMDGHTVQVQVSSGTLLREPERQLSRVIPRVIFNLSAPMNKMASEMARRALKNVRETSDLIHCKSLYLVIEDDACIKEVEASGVPNFVEAYNALRSGSYRADLLRYYLLYKYGGVYLDNKSLMRHPLDSVEFDSFMGGEEPCQMFMGHIETVWVSVPEIAFMGSRKGSPIMLKALEMGIANVMNRFYGKNALSITGNVMFGNSLKEDVAHQALDCPSSTLRETWIRYWGEKVALLPIHSSDDKIEYDNDILWHRQAIPHPDWPKPPTYYNNLWISSTVYTDGNPTPRFRILPATMSHKTRQDLLAYTVFFTCLILVGFILSRYPPIQWI